MTWNSPLEGNREYVTKLIVSEQSVLRGDKSKFNIFSIGASATKSLKGQGFSGMGCLKIFWGKGKNKGGRKG